MNFQQAYEAMKAGQHVTRAAWANRQCFMDGKLNFIVLVVYKPSPQSDVNIGAYQLIIDDLEAQDWAVVDTSWNNRTLEPVEVVATVQEPVVVQ